MCDRVGEITCVKFYPSSPRMSTIHRVLYHYQHLLTKVSTHANSAVVSLPGKKEASKQLVCKVSVCVCVPNT